VEVDVVHTGQWAWAEYDSMSVDSENDNYRLHVTGYHGNANDALGDFRSTTWRSDGKPFSTPDVDNDDWPGGNCASDRRAGWWHSWCATSFLTGSGYWWSSDVRASRMMLQCGLSG